MFAKRFSRFFQDIVQGGLALSLLLSALPLQWVGVVLGNLQAIGLGQVFDGFDEVHASMFHQETDGIAVFAAAKAVEKLLARTDRERGRFLAVKGAQPHVVGAALFQLNIPAHHLNHIGAGQQFLDKGLRNRHAISRRSHDLHVWDRQRRAIGRLGAGCLAIRWACPLRAAHGFCCSRWSWCLVGKCFSQAT